MPLSFKKIAILFITVVVGANSFAQLNAGKVVSYKKVNGGIEGKTTNCIFDVHVYNDNIIRVRISKEKAFRNFSYALASNDIPAFNSLQTAENDNSIFISTNSVNAEIQKSPFLKIIFRNKNNEIINADEDDFRTTFNGDKVSIYKKLQEG